MPIFEADTESTTAVLEELERDIYMALPDRYASIHVSSQHDPAFRATIVRLIVKALGETLATFEYPTNWKRLLARKDCPAYMKKLTTMNVNAYYPKLQIPSEKNWINIEKAD